MYVLMDIEWSENEKEQLCLTQIVVLRVDDMWEENARFDMRVRPHHPSFHQWDFMAFNGGSAADFLSAQPLAEVLHHLALWLKEDDILCLWIRDHADKLNSMYMLTLHQKLTQDSVYLRKYLHALPQSSDAPKRECLSDGERCWHSAL